VCVCVCVCGCVCVWIDERVDGRRGGIRFAHPRTRRENGWRGSTSGGLRQALPRWMCADSQMRITDARGGGGGEHDGNRQLKVGGGGGSEGVGGDGGGMMIVRAAERGVPTKSACLI
jgi:hypothetical protein